MVYSTLFSRRTGLIILHPLLITFILLSSYPIIHSVPTPFWFIILASFILTSIFFLVQALLPEKVFFYIVFLLDIPLIGSMIHYSGGVESIFPLLYILLIIAASLYLYKTGAYIVSVITVVFFLGLLFYEMQPCNMSCTDSTFLDCYSSLPVFLVVHGQSVTRDVLKRR